MRILFFLLPIIGISSLLSCGQSSKEENPTSKISSEVIFGDSNQEFLSLNAEAKELVRSWSAFEDVFRQVQDLNGSSYAALRNKSEILLRSSDSLTANIPSRFDTQPIKSRVLVLQTFVELLYQDLHIETVNEASVNTLLKELNLSLNYLLLQLNEKIAKDKIDLQQSYINDSERTNQQEYKDSIFQLELEDTRSF